jgi:POT family proton-dependent oligopeptide transporter
MEITRPRPDPPSSGSGHHREVLWLSATELWERFTFYGLRALLVLHLVAAPAAGGFGLTDADAAAVYGLYAATVYLSALPGGLLADRYLGPVRSIWLAGSAMLAGNLVLAFADALATFAAGLALVALGAGTLKASIVPLVARAARREGRSLDAAFTIFYVGINIGGIGGPLLAATLASRFGWSAGYLAAAAGMALGLITYSRIARLLTDPGDVARIPSPGVLFASVAGLAAAGLLVATVPPVALVKGFLAVVSAATVAGFIYLHRCAESDVERRNVVTLAGLFCGAVVFWSAGEQAAASLTLFAARFTDRVVLGSELPAAWFQSLYPAGVVLLAPLFALAWTRLARRGADPDAVAKFGAGLLVGGGGIALAAAGAFSAPQGGASPLWLVGTYLLIAIGEILLSPIGLGAAARYAPASRVAFATGLWFLSLGLGGLFAGLTGSLFDLGSASGLGAAFASIAALLAAAGTIFLIVSRRSQGAASG